jgi:hypothetical protein
MDLKWRALRVGVPLPPDVFDEKMLEQSIKQQFIENRGLRGIGLAVPEGGL